MSVRIARINHPPTVGKAIPEQKAIQDQEFTFTFAKDTFKEQDDGDNARLRRGPEGRHAAAFLARLRPQRPDVPRRAPGRRRGHPGHHRHARWTRRAPRSSTDFALKVVNVDDPPSLVSRIPDQAIDQDQPLAFTLSEDTFTDPDLDTGDTLKLRAEGPDGGTPAAVARPSTPPPRRSAARRGTPTPATSWSR